MSSVWLSRTLFRLIMSGLADTSGTSACYVHFFLHILWDRVLRMKLQCERWDPPSPHKSFSTTMYLISLRS